MKAQPIETAPKDGSFIILIGKSGNILTEWHACSCRYDTDYEGTAKPWRDHEGCAFEFYCGYPPEYWVPMPEVK